MADIVWTKHAEFKMRQYGLSRQRILGVFRRPERREVGIVPRTVAAMCPVSPKDIGHARVWRQEIWMLYQERKARQPQVSKNSDRFPLRRSASEVRIISAWRYPGMSPKDRPIPENILREFEESGILEEGE